MASPSSKWKNLLIQGSRWITPCIIALAVVGFYLGKDLQLKLSLTDLLPDDHPSVLKFNKITEIVGGVGYLIVVLNSEDGKSHMESVPQLVTRLEKNPLVRSAFFEREEYFFASRMLYYVDLPDLKKLEKTVDDKITAQKRKAFDLGLWDEEELKTEEVDTKVKDAAKRAAEVTPFLKSKDAKNLLLMVKPTFDSLDIAKTKTLIKFTQETLDANLPSSVSYQMAGRYYKKIADSKVIEADILWLGGLAVALIFLLLLVYLRSFRAVLLITLPVICGLGLTIGLTRLFIGHVNIITGFLMGIVSGLGMDYSVHLALRLRLENRDPSSTDPDASWRALSTSGHAVFVGALAAAVAFFLLCFSSFRAFSEFGFVCGTGIVCVCISLLFSFSALSKWFGLDRKGSWPDSGNWGSLPALRSKPAFYGSIAATLAVLISGYLVSFEYDFDKMLQHSKKVTELSNLVDRIYERSVVPSVFAAPTLDTATGVENLLNEKYVPKTVQTVISGATIIPKEQPQKVTILERIKKKIRRFKDSWLEETLDIPPTTIRRWVDAKPFGFEALPIHLQDGLRGKSQSDYLMYIYPAISLSNLEGVKTYAGMIRDLEKEFPRLLSGSDTVVFAEILDLIKRDGSLILMTIFIAVGFFIWVNVRRVDDSLASYLPLVFALPIGMGLMALLGIKFNIFNIAIIPSFVAIGIDVPIHIVHRARERRSGFKAAKDIAAAVHLALATTVIGFGVLIFARAGVLRSLGWLALLGTIAIWWVGMFLLPAILERYYRSKDSNSTPPLRLVHNRTPSPKSKTG